ncbi:MAG TPA: hypothetical protein VMZ33_00360 [Candidatus Limnocylindrales bacterium]|nr:hypothetical protein [Candidatus Limnocylindrales bacterium]
MMSLGRFPTLLSLLAVLACVVAIPESVHAQTPPGGPGGVAASWTQPGQPGDLNGSVKAFATIGSDLYMAGQFTNVGGDPAADYVVRWDGTDWHALGSNGSGDGALGAATYDLAVMDDDLYVAGSFLNAAGIPQADNLARWDGAAWSAVGGYHGNGVFNGFVAALAVSGDRLYAGGSFQDVAGKPAADNIARWNGRTWSAIGSDGNGNGAVGSFIYDIAVGRSGIYAAGGFQNAGGHPEADHVARWNGSEWLPLGSNGAGGPAINALVHALVIHGDDLFVGGAFVNAGGNPRSDYVARWGAGSWHNLGSNGAGNGRLTDAVGALIFWAGQLYVGGWFRDMRNLDADYLARWTGTGWEGLDYWDYTGGAVSPTMGLAHTTDHLFVGTNANFMPPVFEYGPLPHYLPDAQIDGTGNNVHNSTGADQTRSARVRPGSAFTFNVLLQNDGIKPDTLRLSAEDVASPGFTVTYRQGTTDITAAVLAGTYESPLIGPGDAFLVRAKVSVAGDAPAASGITRLVTATSVNDAASDTVRFRVSTP